MSSSEMWRREDLVRTDVSEEIVASVFRLGRISEGTVLVVTSHLFSQTPTVPNPRRRQFSLQGVCFIASCFRLDAQ
jgi:hypothetical protein